MLDVRSNLQRNVGRAVLCEFLGTAVLLCAVIGSGIMGKRLSPGNIGIALLANTMATVLILYVLIEVCGTESGAHFNPVVSVVMALRGQLAHSGRVPLAVLYIAAQMGGALVGAILANAMFDGEIIHLSAKVRTGPGQWLAEAVAAAGVIFLILRAPRDKAGAVGAWLAGRFEHTPLNQR